MAGETQLGSASIPIRATLDKLDGDLAQARNKVENASGGIFASLSKVGGAAVLGGLALAAGAIAGIGAAAINAREQLDEAYDTIIAKTGASGEALEGLTQDFKEVFTSVPTEAKPAADVISELNAKLGITGEVLQNLSRPLLEASRLMGGDASTNAGLMARVMGDWSIANEDGAATLDKIFVAAQKSGIGMDQLMTKVVGFGSPMRLMGFTLDDTIALFAKWEAEGVNAELVMGSLRIAAGKFADAGKPLRESLMETFDSIKNNEDATAALALGMEVFGARAGPDMTAAIREGRFEIDDMVKALQGADGAIMATSKELEGFEEKFEKLKNKALVALEPIGTAIMEGIGAKVMDAAIPALDALVGFIEETLTPAIEAASEVVGKLLEGDWEGVAEDLRGLYPALEPIAGLFDKLAAGEEISLEDVLGALADAVRLALPDVSDAFGEWAGAAWDWLQDVAGKVDEKMGELAGKLKEWSESEEGTEAFRGIGRTLAGWTIDGIKDLFTDDKTKDDAGRSIGDGLKSWMEAAWTFSFKAVYDIFMGIISEIIGFFFKEEAKKKFDQFGTDFWNQAGDVLVAAFPPMWTIKGPKIIQQLWTKFWDQVHALDWGRIGREIWDLVMRGITPSGLSIGDALRNALGGGGGGGAYQHGLDAVVPPGFPNDSFFMPMNLTSGERVQVTPAGQAAPQGQEIHRHYHLTYTGVRPEPGRLDAAAAMRELELYGRLVS